MLGNIQDIIIERPAFSSYLYSVRKQKMVEVLVLLFKEDLGILRDSNLKCYAWQLANIWIEAVVTYFNRPKCFGE